jgi:methylmalonyl-CoA mutase cobalamin-binding subunit
MAKKIVGASIGTCVHVAGVQNFLKLAEEHGYETRFLGPSVSIEKLLEAVKELNPDIVSIGYRLSPQPAKRLFEELKERIEEEGLQNKEFVFGGTPPVAVVAKEIGIFDRIFSGQDAMDEVIAYLKRGGKADKIGDFSDNLVERINSMQPYPLIRHHFGLPSLEDTINGAKQIAEARVLDILSLGPDQNAQECFFRPEEMDSGQSGAGGVPIRRPQDLIEIFDATRCGNYPLLRCYSGTRDIIKMAEVLSETINNAWCAVPISWYNVLDGRSPRKLLETVNEAQQVMKWHAIRGIPVEVNEAHQWSLRDAHDTLAVAMAFLAAYNAKKMGVRHYISQYMFNTPPGISMPMDLAKMLAKIELIESLHNDKFISFRQVRAGLYSFPTDLDSAKGQLASSTFLSMALKPRIVHVVAYCEGQYIATPKEIIESCKIAKRVISNCLFGMPNMTLDPEIQKRKRELISEANILLEAIRKIADNDIPDPWINPETLVKSIEIGLLDAPQLQGNRYAKGEIATRINNGACYAVNPKTNEILSEKERISRIL